MDNSSQNLMLLNYSLVKRQIPDLTEKKLHPLIFWNFTLLEPVLTSFTFIEINTKDFYTRFIPC